jgi:hypothetical protein
MLLLLIVFIVCYSKLINAVGKNNIGELLWEVYTNFSLSQTSKDLRHQKRRAIDVHAQRANTSSKDEFAKWAKLDREYSTVKSKIEKLSMYQFCKVIYFY